MNNDAAKKILQERYQSCSQPKKDILFSGFTTLTLFNFGLLPFIDVSIINDSIKLCQKLFIREQCKNCCHESICDLITFFKSQK